MTAFNNNNEIIPPSVNIRYLIDLRIWGKKKPLLLCIVYVFIIYILQKQKLIYQQLYCKLLFDLYNTSVIGRYSVTLHLICLLYIITDRRDIII